MRAHQGSRFRLAPTFFVQVRIADTAQNVPPRILASTRLEFFLNTLEETRVQGKRVMAWYPSDPNYSLFLGKLKRTRYSFMVPLHEQKTNM